MVLDSKTTDKIKSFVYQKPRNIDEVAKLIGKNWRTADRYVREIVERTGTIGVRTFREGTRGALKIAFWQNIEKIYSTKIQEAIFRRIEVGIDKSDFSPFEIYQYIDKEKRSAILNKEWNIVDLFRMAKEEILILSGNLTFLDNKIINVIEKLADNNIYLKVLCRVDIVSINQVERLLAVNDRIKREMVDTRHYEQPLRGFIIDNKISSFKEVKSPLLRDKELKKPLKIYYEIYDTEWNEWLKNLFFKQFQNAIPAGKRIEDIKSIKNTQY